MGDDKHLSDGDLVVVIMTVVVLVAVFGWWTEHFDSQSSLDRGSAPPVYWRPHIGDGP